MAEQHNSKESKLECLIQLEVVWLNEANPTSLIQLEVVWLRGHP